MVKRPAEMTTAELMALRDISDVPWPSIEIGGKAVSVPPFPPSDAIEGASLVIFFVDGVRWETVYMGDGEWARTTRR